MSDPLRVTYELTLPTNGASGDRFERRARELARSIAVEQTAELPEGSIPSEIDDRFVGAVETVDSTGDGGERRARVVVAYPDDLFDGTVAQLLTVLYGNVSLRGDVRVVDVDWPDWLLEWLPGPRFGVDGLRSLVGVDDRALLCTALKPVGLSTDELADLAYRFARGGVDLVKDDHGLFDQERSLFQDRVDACHAAVERANAETGGSTLYVPNLTSPLDLLAERVVGVRRRGIEAALVAPFVSGLDSLRWLAEESELALMAHPAFSGGLVAADGSPTGVAPGVVYGDLLRLLGADGVISPPAGGRFPRFTVEVCDEIADRLRRPLGSVPSAWPVFGGGVRLDAIDETARRYGPDAVVLVAGALYQEGDREGDRQEGDVESAARRAREILEVAAGTPTS